ncbi:MAG: DUF2800 domain-containing protein [Gemmatimonadota bacterium]
MSANPHAILGASSASRWLACPGSVREIAALPAGERNRTSTYADEGSAAHTLGEKCLTNSYSSAARFIDTLIPGKLQDWPVTDEMAESVQVYLDEVAYHVDRLKGQLFVEKSVKPIDRDDMWGTADAIIYEPFGELVVIDFKYGKGVVIETDWNDQMMYYGLGGLREIGFNDVSKVTLVVVQPRAIHVDGPVRRWFIGKDILRDFSDHLVSGADLTKDPDAPLKAGKHCRFCPVAPTCPAMRAVVMRAASDDFADLPEEIEEPGAHVKLPDPQDAEELGRAMQLVPLLDFWVSEVQSLARRRLEHGQEVPGFKLVRGRANRAWKDADDVERRLRNMKGVSVDDIYGKKLKSPAQLEKVKALGDKSAERKKWVAKHTYKPEGTLSVAPERDPREAVEAPLLTDFASSIDDSPASGSRTEGQN